MTPIANLMVSVQQLYGVDSESYGVAHAAYCDLYPAIKEAMPQ